MTGKYWIWGRRACKLFGKKVIICFSVQLRVQRASGCPLTYCLPTYPLSSSPKSLSSIINTVYSWANIGRYTVYMRDPSLGEFLFLWVWQMCGISTSTVSHGKVSLLKKSSWVALIPSSLVLGSGCFLLWCCDFSGCLSFTSSIVLPLPKCL